MGLEKKYREAAEAHSHGIAYAPFYAPNYFGRGGKHSLLGESWQAVAEYTMCIQLDPQNWLYTSYCELGRYKEAQECLSLIKDDVVPPQMDYGYSMCVKLYKGLL